MVPLVTGNAVNAFVVIFLLIIKVKIISQEINPKFSSVIANAVHALLHGHKKHRLPLRKDQSSLFPLSGSKVTSKHFLHLK